jgi:hypothetical protein
MQQDFVPYPRNSVKYFDYIIAIKFSHMFKTPENDFNIHVYFPEVSLSESLWSGFWPEIKL